MASNIDQNKLKVAIDWINKLANGMNPIDGKVLPDSDIVLRLTAKVTAICENQPPSAVRNDYSVFGTRRNSK